MPVLPRYCYGLPRISIIPWITPIVLNILKHLGSNPDRHGSPRNCHGQAKDLQGFVTVSLQFFVDAPGLKIRGYPASEPGQWDLGLTLTSHIPMYVRSQDASLPSATSDVTKQQTITKSVLISPEDGIGYWVI